MGMGGVTHAGMYGCDDGQWIWGRNPFVFCWGCLGLGREVELNIQEQVKKQINKIKQEVGISF